MIREYIRGVLFMSAVISTAFFLVFSVHALTPEQQEAKQFLDGVTQQAPFAGFERAHMQDVRTVLDWARILSAILIVAALFALGSATRTSTVFAGTALILLPVLLAFIPWEQFFEGFHQLFFPQGNWVFPYDSQIIQTYPPKLFLWSAGAWGALCITSGLVLVLRKKILAPRSESST